MINKCFFSLSWDNQLIRKSDSAASSPVGFDLDVDVLGKAVELNDMEEKLNKHRSDIFNIKTLKC